MSLEDLSPSRELGDFFDAIWGDIEGFVYLPTRDQSTETWKKVFYEWPLKKDAVIKHVLATTAKGFDSYFAPAIFNKPDPHKETNGVSNVLGSNVLWTEFDGNAPSLWEPQDLSVSDVGAQSRLVPPPSLRIQSSKDGHEHVYWKLNEFSRDINWIENCNRSIAYSLKADTSGWDINQILRPPATTNYKHNLPVTTAHINGAKYGRVNFAELKPALQLVSDSIVTDDLPNVESVVAKYQWDTEHFEMFSQRTIEEGKRSSALMRLGYFCAEAGMSDNEAYAILDNADLRWGKFVGRQDRKRRLLDIINRARQKHPVGNNELNFRGLLGAGSDGEISTNVRLIYGFQDFLDSEVKVEWLIEGLLEKAGLGMVASKPGVGKTQWSLQLAASSALGIPFLGWTVPESMKVLFLSLEMSHVALKLFMTSIALGYTQEQKLLLQENLILVPLGEAIPFDRADGIKFIEAIMDETKPDLVIIDSLGKTLMTTLDEGNVRTLNNAFGRLRSKYNCGFWFIHHNRKENGDNKKPTELDDIYGSMYITSEVTSAIILWPDKSSKSIVHVIPVKSRLAPLRDEFLTTRDPETLKFSRTAAGEIPVGLAEAAAKVETAESKEEPDATNSTFDFE